MIHKRRKSSTLVLLTRQFPSPEGDYAFLKNEIARLAGAFDRVLVFPYVKKGAPPVDLPPNAEYCGRVTEATSGEGWRQILTPAGAWRAMRALFTEWRHRRVDPANFRFTVEAISHGTKFAKRVKTAVGRTEGPVVVYSFWGTAAAVTLPFLPGRYRKLVRLHGHDLYENPEAPILLRRAIFNAVDQIVPISEHGNRYLTNHYPGIAESGKIRTSRLGTPDGGPGPVPPADGSWTIVSCAYIRDIKRLDMVLEAVATLARFHPVRWVHFGGGDNEQQFHDLALATQEQSPNLELDLRWTTPNEDIRTFYGEEPVHAMVSLSSTEGLPVSIMEAMSFAIPVVATDVGGTSELVGTELRSGVLLPANPTINEAVDALKFVCENRESFQPRDVWKERTEADTAADRLIEILRGVIPSESGIGG